jgi:tRNA threonylcarbamoyladenosine biosynthesis protein TsaB
MPTILAIETSTELASVALLHRGGIIAHEAEGVHTHSQTLLPMVQAVLAQAEIGLAQCDAIAFGAGPGAFTGVRTACGAAQGLAFGLELPVVPVVTLEAMAQGCRASCGATDVLVVLDARMEEVYWAQYRYQDGWHVVTAPTLSPPKEVSVSGTVVACGNGLTAYASAFDAMPFARNARTDVMPHARYVAHLAEREVENGRVVNARDAQPLYLRNKVALTTVERLAKVAA